MGRVWNRTTPEPFSGEGRVSLSRRHTRRPEPTRRLSDTELRSGPGNDPESEGIVCRPARRLRIRTRWTPSRRPPPDVVPGGGERSTGRGVEHGPTRGGVPRTGPTPLQSSETRAHASPPPRVFRRNRDSRTLWGPCPVVYPPPYGPDRVLPTGPFQKPGRPWSQRSIHSLLQFPLSPVPSCRPTTK